MPKIEEQRHCSLTEAERLELAKLLAKAGYRVRLGRERPKGKETGSYKHFVEYEE